MIAYKTVIARRQNGHVQYSSIHQHLRDSIYIWEVGKCRYAVREPLTACTIPAAALHYAQSYVNPSDEVALLECEVNEISRKDMEIQCSEITPIRELPFSTFLVAKSKGDGPHFFNESGERMERHFRAYPP
jgi:hypothetical protein